MQLRFITAALVACLLGNSVAAIELSELDGSPVSSMQQLEGKVVLGNGVIIGANCILKDVTIGDNTEIDFPKNFKSKF